MKHLELKTFSTNVATFGNLYCEGKLICKTFELPWRNNAINVSCIPAGTYNCETVISPKFGHTYKVLNVKDRSHILFHKGNTEDDTQGCIMPCTSYGILNGSVAGLSSKAAYDAFMSFLEGNKFTLTIHRE